jgi:hypothetical protein
MYRSSSQTSQLDLFSSVSSMLKGKALKTYNDTSKWHNQFRVQVTNRIDEDIYRANIKGILSNAFESAYCFARLSPLRKVFKNI